MWDEVTDLLVTFAARRRGYGGLRTWFGPVGDLGRGDPAYLVASHMGLRIREPQTAGDPTLLKITRAQAERTLACLMTDNLVMPSYAAPRSDDVQAIASALDSLGPAASFYSNGDWHRWPVAGGSHWRAMTPATFDAGVIGTDGTVGFLVWVEEED